MPEARRILGQLANELCAGLQSAKDLPKGAPSERMVFFTLCAVFDLCGHN